MNSEIIQKRQNEENCLKMQYAARFCFNSAEKINYLAWIACLISAFSVFLPDKWSKYILCGIPFVFDILAYIFTCLAASKVKLASALRKAFDSYVLGIPTDQRSESELYRLREKVIKIIERNPDIAATQIANNGNDSPPGVRDWYVFSKPIDGMNAQLECQRQNVWWDKKMFRIRYMLYLVLFAVLVIVFTFLSKKKGILLSVLSSAGFLMKIIERVIVNKKYINISKYIDGSLKTLEAHPTAEGITALQNMIDQRRELNVLELNFFHKKMANKLTKIYETILSR